MIDTQSICMHTGIDTLHGTMNNVQYNMSARHTSITKIAQRRCKHADLDPHLSCIEELCIKTLLFHDRVQQIANHQHLITGGKKCAERYGPAQSISLEDHSCQYIHTVGFTCFPKSLGNPLSGNGGISPSSWPDILLLDQELCPNKEGSKQGQVVGQIETA
jgi:hypothetical protein